MGCTLTAGINTVVAGNTVSSKRGMIRYRSSGIWNRIGLWIRRRHVVDHIEPVSCVVTVVTFQRCRCVQRRQAVATTACPEDLGMIHRLAGYRPPVCRKYRMTGITDIRAGNMLWRLPTGLHTVMTGEASTDYLGMIHHYHRQPIHTMTSNTFTGCW